MDIEGTQIWPHNLGQDLPASQSGKPFALIAEGHIESGVAKSEVPIYIIDFMYVIRAFA